MGAEVRAEGVVVEPSERLRPYLASCTGYRYEGMAPGTHQGLPSPFLTVVMSLDRPLDLTALPDPSLPPARFDALVAGLHDSPATVTHDGNQHGIQLYLTPLGARALLGLPAAELTGAVVHLGDLFGPHAGHLLDRLHETPSWPMRFAVLEQALSARLRDVRLPSAEVALAWERLVATRGCIDVAALAAGVGWSTRHLSERFRAEFGMAPKRAARVIRFDAARRLLGSPRRPSIASVAASCGYADQAHLTREFRALAGITPVGWLGDELRSLQDEAVLHGAG